MAIDIAMFTPPDEFQARVDEFVAYVKSAQCAKGFTEFTVPGERAGKERVHRLADGIPIDNITLEQLRTLATELDVSC